MASRMSTENDLFLLGEVDKEHLQAVREKHVNAIHRLADLCSEPSVSRSDHPTLVEFGEDLYRLAFPERSDATDRLIEALRTGSGPIRLWMRSDDSKLAGLPWEFMRLPVGLLAAGSPVDGLGWGSGKPPFLALHPRIQLVRHVSECCDDVTMLKERGALRLLIVSANPACRHWGWVDVRSAGTYVRHCLNGLSSDLVDPRELLNATPAGLEQQLREFRPHVLHFTGHGARPFRGKQRDYPAALVLHPESGQRCPAYLDAHQLAAWCQDAGVRAVVLNSCWSAAGGDRGLAMALTKAGVPVVVAMQLPLVGTAAFNLSQALYHGLLTADSFESCVQSYRTACAASLGAGVPVWGVPAVFLRVRDSALFHKAAANPSGPSFRRLADDLPFVGRRFLFDRVADWLSRAEVSRSRRGGVFALIAAQGLGKTAFAKEWARRRAEEEKSAGVFFSFHDHPTARTDPDECLRSLYGQLAPRYQLIESQVAASTAAKLRALLVEDVSPRCVKAGWDEVIVIDALDAISQSDWNLGEVLPEPLPPRVHVIVTSRPGRHIDAVLAVRPDITAFRLEGRSAENLMDAEEYSKHRLQTLKTTASAAPALDLDARLHRLVARTAGNFQLLRFLFDPRSGTETTTLADIERAAGEYGEDLARHYQASLDRVLMNPFQNDLIAWETLVDVLGALATAGAPVTQAQVCMAFGLNHKRWVWAVEHLGELIRRGAFEAPGDGVEDSYDFYQEPFRELILGRPEQDLRDLHAHWAAYAQGWSELQGYARVYALRWLPHHLLRAGQGRALAETLLDHRYLATALGARDDPPTDPPRSPFALVADFDSARDMVPPELRDAIRLVGGALSLCAPVLIDAPRELPTQLVGRLRQSDEPVVRAWLERLAPSCSWLRPLTSALGEPGGPLLRVMAGHQGAVWDVALTGDGRAVSVSDDSTLRVWDLAGGVCERGFLAADEGVQVNRVVVTNDGLAVSGSEDGFLRWWSLGSNDCVREVAAHAKPINQLVVLPDGRLVSASDDGTLWIGASGAEDTEPSLVLKGHSGPVNWVAVLRDGRLISASGDHTLRVWEPATWQSVVLKGHTSPVTRVAVTADGTAVSGSEDGILWRWDLASYRGTELSKRHQGSIKALLPIDDGRLISASADRTLRCWDLGIGEFEEWLGHTEAVTQLALTADGSCAVSVSEDRTLRVWDLKTGECIRVLQRHTGTLHQVALTRDGRAVTASADSTLRLWDLNTNVSLKPLAGHRDSVTRVVLTPDETRAVTASWDGTLRVWDVASGACVSVLEGGHTEWVYDVAVTDKDAISASGDGTLGVWDLASGRCRHHLIGHPDAVQRVILTADGRAVSASIDSTLRVWDWREGVCLRVLEGHRGAVNCLVVLGDDRVVSGSADGSLRWWDLNTGVCHRVVQAHSGPINHLAITADGRFVSASDDATLRLWDPSGTQLRGHTAPVTHFVLTADGRCVSVGKDHRALVWDLARSICIGELIGHTGTIWQVALAGEQRVATVSQDRTLRLWSLEDHGCLARVTADGAMIACAVTSDGRTLVAGDAAGGVHVLHVENDEPA